MRESPAVLHKEERRPAYLKSNAVPSARLHLRGRVKVRVRVRVRVRANHTSRLFPYP